MSIVVNGTNIPSNGDIVVNGVHVTKVVANNVTVWEKVTREVIMSNGVFSTGYGSGYGYKSDYYIYSNNESPATGFKGVAAHSGDENINFYVYTGNLTCSSHATCSVTWESFHWGDPTTLNSIIEASLDNGSFVVVSNTVQQPDNQILNPDLCLTHSFSIAGHSNVNIRIRLNGYVGYQGGQWLGLGFHDIIFE